MAIGHQFSLVVIVVGIHGVFISVCMYLYDACKYLLASLEYSSVFFYSFAFWACCRPSLVHFIHANSVQNVSNHTQHVI